MKKLCSLLLGVCLLALCLCLLPQNAHAETEGYYTYTVTDNKVTITNCDTAISGAVTIPNTLGGYPVASIGNSAFYGCTGLTSVTIPDSVTSIGDWVFENCTGLTSITIPDSVTSIGDYAFENCTGLTSITIPDSVTSIGYETFRNCTKLMDVYITDPNSWCKISFGKFNANPMCYGGHLHILNEQGEEVTEVVLGNSVTTIPAYAFSGCTGLTSITIPDSVTSIGYEAFCNCTGLTSVTIPDSVTSIGYRTFYGCTGLTSVTIPDSVTSIDYEAFSDCTGLTTITIPDSVTDLGDYAFYNCAGLTIITIPGSVTTIGDSAFYWCTGLTDVYITDPNSWCKISFGADSHPMYYGDRLHILNEQGEEVTELVLDNSVTTIPAYAFSGCTRLTSITIPDSVTSIGSSAFYGCTGLTSITIPDSVTFIGDATFYGCTGLTSITIPDSVTFIGDATFYGCTGLTSITIPNSVTSIGRNVFSDCTGLTSITIPDSVTDLGDYAFRNCTGLTSITIPDSVTSIGVGAFVHCIGLTNITIPNSVTTIEAAAFAVCTGLTSVTIPDSVTSIAGSAFSGCTGLTSVTIPDSVTSIDYEAFSGCTALKTVYYSGTEEQKADIAIGDDNEPLINATWRSAILPTITPKYPSLSFEDEVYISVYFTVSDMTDVVDLGLVVSSDETVDENDTMVTEYDYKASGDMCSVRTHGIPAKSLGETIYFKGYAKLSDGSYVYSGVYNYSALAYAKDRLANSSNENLKKLCVAMLNYGAAAQTYMGYNVDSLANATLTADQLAMVDGYNSSMIASVTAVDSDKMGVFTRSGFGKCYPSISFEGAFSISYYFTPSYTSDNGMKLYYWDKEAFDGVDVLTVDNATGVLDMTVSGTAYKGAVEGIAAKEVDETIFVAGVYEYDGVTYCTGVIPYSLGAYCVDRAANGSAAMIPLAEATAVYGYYAKQYFVG